MKQLFKFPNLLITLLSALLFSCTESVEAPISQPERVDYNPKIQQAINLAMDEIERLFPSESRSSIRTADISSVKFITTCNSRNSEDTIILCSELQRQSWLLSYICCGF